MLLAQSKLTERLLIRLAALISGRVVSAVFSRCKAKAFLKHAHEIFRIFITGNGTDFADCEYRFFQKPGCFLGALDAFPLHTAAEIPH